MAAAMVGLTCLIVAQAGGAGQSKSAGQPDRSFSGDGIASFQFDGEYAGASGIAETPSHKIVQGVLRPERAGSVLRYKRGGRIDHKFGSGGVAELAFKSGVVNPRDVLVGHRGRIVVAGEGYLRNGDQFGGAVARLRPDGKPDRSFAGDGFSLPGFASEVTPLELAFAKGGKIIVVGLVGGIPSAGVYVARYLPNGRLDRSFAGDGYRIIRVGAAQSWRSVAVDPRGRIVLGAGTLRKGSWILTVIRLRPGGQFDRKFSGDGRAEAGPSGIQMQDVAIDRRGRILAAGSDYSGVIVRFRRDGRLDRTFAKNGTKSLPHLSPSSVSVDRKNRIIVTASGDEVGAVIERLKPNGDNDRRFDGYIAGMSGFDDHIFDSHNRIVAGGSVERSRVGVARVLNP